LAGLQEGRRHKVDEGRKRRVLRNSISTWRELTKKGGGTREKKGRGKYASKGESTFGEGTENK